jgi:hypothetical protein
VLAGKTNWQDIKTETRWLGGVEIEPGAKGWRWDRDERVVVRAVASKAARKTPKRSVAKKKPSPAAKKRAPRKRENDRR